ncbi:MAG: hypothetical protein ACI9F9_000203 [Candidatus Paceibacteria bacterium]|jgi:hypothetical protein
MNPIIKKSLMGLGGLILFAATYVAIAIISGAPLHEVPGISSFVEPPDDAKSGDTQDEVAKLQNENSKTGSELLNSNAGLLGAFMMDAPFTASGLRDLENELKKKLIEQTVERKTLEVRSLELDEWEFSLRERQAALATQRGKLEDVESKINLRTAELERDESVAKDRARQGWRDMAAIYKGGEAEVNAGMLRAESAEDAALILRELDASQVGEILRLITPASERKKYSDAYRLATNTDPE